MKLVTAYVERERFDPIREELLDLGFRSISAWDATGSIPEPTLASYRGAVVETHTRPKTRMECVTGDDQAQTVVDTVLKHAGERRFVFVVNVDEAIPAETVNVGDSLTTAG
jgi:nitrogen regulatory protein PII